MRNIAFYPGNMKLMVTGKSCGLPSWEQIGIKLGSSKTRYFGIVLDGRHVFTLKFPNHPWPRWFSWYLKDAQIDHLIWGLHSQRNTVKSPF